MIDWAFIVTFIVAFSTYEIGKALLKYLFIFFYGRYVRRQMVQKFGQSIVDYYNRVNNENTNISQIKMDITKH